MCLGKGSRASWCPTHYYGLEIEDTAIESYVLRAALACMSTSYCSNALEGNQPFNKQILPEEKERYFTTSLLREEKPLKRSF